MVECLDDDSDESWEVKSYHGPLEAMECQVDAACCDDIADKAADKAAGNAASSRTDKAAENAADKVAAEEFPQNEKCLDVVCLNEECSDSDDVIIGDVKVGSASAALHTKPSTKAGAWRDGFRTGTTRLDKGKNTVQKVTHSHSSQVLPSIDVCLLSHVDYFKHPSVWRSLHVCVFIRRCH